MKFTNQLFSLISFLQGGKRKERKKNNSYMKVQSQEKLNITIPKQNIITHNKSWTISP